MQVILDIDLAEMYQVETRVLNQAVKRNLDRFPIDFMFQLSNNEFDSILISQFVISSSEHGGRRKLPYVFTAQGVSMLSSVLKSSIAVHVSISIIRAFVENYLHPTSQRLRNQNILPFVFCQFVIMSFAMTGKYIILFLKFLKMNVMFKHFNRS